MTKEWLKAASDDLRASENLLQYPELTNIIAFHCQQCIEKSFKAIAEEKEVMVSKTHDLIKLHFLLKDYLVAIDLEILREINELYIDSRYPGEMGLLPNGKPGKQDAERFFNYTKILHETINELLK
jgi:HEPN domain-containing protein